MVESVAISSWKLAFLLHYSHFKYGGEDSSKVFFRNRESNPGPLALEPSALPLKPLPKSSFLVAGSCRHYGLASLNQPHLSLWWGVTCFQSLIYPPPVPSRTILRQLYCLATDAISLLLHTPSLPASRSKRPVR